MCIGRFAPPFAPYCDFNVCILRDGDDNNVAVWQAAYTRSWIMLSLRPQGPVETVFFGGGTPSLMSPDLVARF